MWWYSGSLVALILAMLLPFARLLRARSGGAA